MTWLLPVLLLGGGYILLKGGSSSSGGAQTPAQLAQQGAAFNAAQSFDQQAQALGLTQAQAQAAYDTGLTPQEYYDGVMGGQASTSGPMMGARVGVNDTFGPIDLVYHGEVEPTTGAPIYRDVVTDAPVMVDDLGHAWTFSESY